MLASPAAMKSSVGKYPGPPKTKVQSAEEQAKRSLVDNFKILSDYEKFVKVENSQTLFQRLVQD